MESIDITCASCRKSWKLPVEGSLHVQLDIESRPCPYCEAYTLSCAAPTPLPPLRNRVWSRRQAPETHRTQH